MNSDITTLKQQFHQTFGPGEHVRIIRSPGRVNLIGEHTDYNDGFVFPMAIDPEVRFVVRGRDDGKVRLASTIFPGQVAEFSVQQKIARGEPTWTNYSRGVAAQLIAAGIPLTGMDVLISNTLPMGGGLSSSAALEVGTALAFLTLTGHTMDVGRLALLCQKAEHEYALVPCGIMDQMIVSSAKTGQATLYDCRTAAKQYVPIDETDLRVVIANTMVKHELSGGEYAQRRRQCEEGVKYFARANPAVKALRDVTMEQVQGALGQLPEIVFRRCRHVVGENLRTTQAAVLLSHRKYEQVGQLMVQSHNSLRDDYEVSCPELDFLVEQAVQIKGVYGARMTGGGFGGCIVALVQPRCVQNLVEQLQAAYNAKYNIDPVIFSTSAAPAASVVE